MRTNKVWLYKNTNLTNEDTMLFDNIPEQEDFFNYKRYTMIETNERVITDSVRVISENYYDLLAVDYISSEKVIDGKTKTMYYFVNEVESVNDNLTILHVELDVIQTYMFDYNIESMYIEREHQDRMTSDWTDTRIFNKNPEPIEVSEFDIKESNLVLPYHKDFDNIYAAIVTIQRPDTGRQDWKYGSMEQNFRTLITFFKHGDSGAFSRVSFVRDNDPTKKEDFANDANLVKLSKNPNVIDIWITPYIPNVKYGGIWPATGQPVINGFHGYEEGISADYEFVKSIHMNDSKDDSDLVVGGMFVVYNMAILEENLKVEDIVVDAELTNMITNMDGQDSKIYGSQYSRIELQFGTGNITELHADEFDPSRGRPDFKFTIGNDVEKVMMVSPDNYRIPNKFISSGPENSLPKITDAYLEYMNNNRHSLQAKNIGNVVNGLTSLATGAASSAVAAHKPKDRFSIITGSSKRTVAPLSVAAAGSAISKGVSFGMDLMLQSAQKRDMKNQPDTFNNVNNIDFNLTNNLVMAKVRTKIPTWREKAKLNDYFNLFGYNASYYGIPNLRSRETFNYLKAGNTVLTGDIPKQHKEKIEEVFNAGVRFWHKDFLDFSKSNDEVY